MQLRADGKTVWLTQLEIAELFQTTKQYVSLHPQNIFEEGELRPEATVKESLTVQTEGGRQVQRTITYFNLDLILAIGYRVRSPRGTQFRQWATAHLREFLVKGFVMDDERLKNPGGWDYFDELLARIREIRASEKRFYQKVRDLFALSSDYKGREQDTQLFFAEAQNKLLYAATRHTAAELIVSRADSAQPNLALMTWSGSRVRKQDAIIAKNYLTRNCLHCEWPEADPMTPFRRSLETGPDPVSSLSSLDLTPLRRQKDKLGENELDHMGCYSVSRIPTISRAALRFMPCHRSERRAANFCDADSSSRHCKKHLGHNIKRLPPR